MKYSNEDWKTFLTEAYERIENHEAGVNATPRQQNTMVSICSNCNKDKKIYTCYECDVIQSLKDFHATHENLLKEAYGLYKNGDSKSFIAQNMKNLDSSKLHYLKRCKILIVTANPVERAVLHQYIINKNPKNKILRYIHGTNSYYIFRWGSYWVAHVHQYQSGSNKDFGTITTVYEALRYVNPNVIIALGVAFGIDYKTQKLGDVLVSKHIFPYAENKRDHEEIKPNRAQDKCIDHWLDVRLCNANGFLSDEHVLYGGILSGGSVMSSAQEKDRICTAYTENDEIIGGEMEGSGLFQVSYFTGIPCVVIKGICDWGVAKNDVFNGNTEKEEKFKDSLQAYAMKQALEKSEPLFNDNVLFDVPKNEMAAHEKRKSGFYKIGSITSVVGIILALIVFFLNYNILNIKIFSISILLITLLINIVLLGMSYKCKSKFIFEDKIKYYRIEKETKTL